ncbi:hypothetical protein [Streptacidiphilus melanogenes]|uniref:hypothetical protein n=1 Tax=Streptacidiphilus melanogenes TaxID=411235 RepID=UPI0005A63982|nr:hypothetical protein [Streptacidiphilus melanogenes]
MTVPPQPGPHIPGFGPPSDYGSAPTEPLPVQPFPPYATAPDEPDWSSMADEHEARNKRKQILAVAVGVLAVCLVGGAALAWNLSGSGGSATVGAAPTGSPSASASAPDSPSASASPSPSAPPALRLDQVFASSLKVGDRAYTRVATDVQRTCHKAVSSGLAHILAADHCTQVLRATYSSGKVSVTVGVAALADVSSAMGTVTHFRGKIEPLWHKGDVAFCKKVTCAQTHAVEGRFLYLTVAGPNSGAAGAKDRTAIAAGHAAAASVLSRLVKLH